MLAIPWLFTACQEWDVLACFALWQLLCVIFKRDVACWTWWWLPLAWALIERALWGTENTLNLHIRPYCIMPRICLWNVSGKLSEFCRHGKWDRIEYDDRTDTVQCRYGTKSLVSLHLWNSLQIWVYFVLVTLAQCLHTIRISFATFLQMILN